MVDHLLYLLALHENNAIIVYSDMLSSSPHQIDVAQQLKCDVRPSTKQLFGRHLMHQCAPLLVEIQAVRRASPILQATERADLLSTAHLGTREFP